MAKFTSDSFRVGSDSNAISNFLGNPNNLIEILPADRIEDWQATNSTCSFKIKGLATINLKLSEVSNTEVIYTSNAEKPFAFKLVISLNDDAGGSHLSAYFDADVNAFMGSMLNGPLTKFLNHLGNQIVAKYA